jgi:hypothetical protein
MTFSLDDPYKETNERNLVRQESGLPLLQRASPTRPPRWPLISNSPRLPPRVAAAIFI